MEFGKRLDFWSQNGGSDGFLFRKVGDYLNRQRIVELVSIYIRSITENTSWDNETIVVDAGCGDGICTFLLLEELGSQIPKGRVRAIGLDKDEAMAMTAQHNAHHSLGTLLYGSEKVEFRTQDCTLPWGIHQTVQIVMACSVLCYLEVLKAGPFLRAAASALESGGRIFVSLPHPYIFERYSPHRTREAKWLTIDRHVAHQRYAFTYRNADLNSFSGELYYYPLESLLILLQSAQLEVEQVHEQYVTEHVLRECNATGPTGYPAYLIIEATKR